MDENEDADGTLANRASQDGEWLSLTQVAEAYGVSKTTLRNWIKKGRLVHREVSSVSGTAWEVPRAAVAEAVRERPRPAGADDGLPVLREQFSSVVAVFHHLADDLTTSLEKAAEYRELAGASAARADALTEEVARLRADADLRVAAERRSAVAEAEVARLRAELDGLAAAKEAAAAAEAKAREAEQAAALAAAEAEALRADVERLAPVAERSRRTWYGRRKTG